jgi:hypothetical protein
MAYLTTSFRTGQNNCITNSLYWPDGAPLRTQITNAYYEILGRYGESDGLEKHRSEFLSKPAEDTRTVYDLVYQGAVEGGELAFVQTYGKHRDLILGSSCPALTSFSAFPNPQTSGSDGIPNYNTTLSWSISATTSVRINGSVVQSFGSPTTVTSSTNRTDLPQSTAGSNSPATKTYTITSSHPTVGGPLTLSSSVTVEVYNDNTPNNFSLPNQNNVNPNTAITVSSTISGIDMVTSVNGGPGVQVSTNGSSFSSNTTITNNQTVYAKVTSLGFNQSPNGLTNSADFYVDVGTLRRFFTVTTRAPDVNETFNLPDEVDRVPYPDIDTIDEPSEEYIVSNTLSVDDIELINPSGVEIRTNNGNTQVRIKRQGASSFSGWTDVRQI